MLCGKACQGGERDNKLSQSPRWGEKKGTRALRGDLEGGRRGNVLLSLIGNRRVIVGKFLSLSGVEDRSILEGKKEGGR